MKQIILIIVLLFTINSYSQDFELRKSPFVRGKLIFKDGSTKKGFVKLNNSAFDVRFKSSGKDKPEKVNYKDLDKIIANPDSIDVRTFQYLKNYQDKFNKFVELILQDKISIYIESSDRLSLFYSDFDRRTGREWMDDIKFKHLTKRNLELNYKVILPNGEEINLPNTYKHYFQSQYVISKKNQIRLSYFIKKENDDKLILVESYKRFLKNSIKHFEDCPVFVDDFRNKKITLGDLPKFIEYYKYLCKK